MLNWIRLKDGSGLRAWKVKKYDFRITKSPPKGVRMYDLFQLTNYGKFICEFPFARGKQSCKNVANAIHNKAPFVYDTVLMSLPKSLKRHLLFMFGEVSRFQRIPKITGPQDKFFRKKAEKGIRPSVARGMWKGEIPEEYVVSQTLALFPIYFPIELKETRKREEEHRKRITPLPEVNKPGVKSTPLAFKGANEVLEHYSGDAPEERSREQRRTLLCPTQNSPCPFKPDNAKFSTLLEWGEKVRDYFEIRGIYIPECYLTYVMRYHDWPEERRKKAENRLNLIYKKDREIEHEYNRRMVERAHLAPDPDKIVKPEKKGKDKWGYRIGSQAAAINEVLTKDLKSVKQIQFETDIKNVGGHLSSLKKKKLVRCIEGKWRLRKQKGIK